MVPFATDTLSKAVSVVYVLGMLEISRVTNKRGIADRIKILAICKFMI
jgi:hypothetical protein